MKKAQIIGFTFANRILVLETLNLEETIKDLTPQFIFAGKPIGGKNVQWKLEFAMGQDLKYTKIPEVRRLKIELVQVEKATNKFTRTDQPILDDLATLVTGLLKAEKDAKVAIGEKAKAESATRREAKAKEKLAKDAKAKADVAAKAEAKVKEKAEAKAKAPTEAKAPKAPKAPAVPKVAKAAQAAPAVEVVQTAPTKPQRGPNGRFLPRTK